MPIKPEELRDAIYGIESGQLGWAELSPPVIQQLLVLNFVKLNASGDPILTVKGQKAFTVLQERGGEVPALDAFDYDDEIEWPTPIPTIDRLPDASALVFAWKPIIDGWDIVLGREVVKSPEQFTHWLPMMPRPD